MNAPDELRYTSDHEWARAEGGQVRIGITDFAQDALGDVVYVQLPTVGTTVAQGDTVGEIESTKSVSEVYTPVSGEVVAVNDDLGEHAGAPERGPLRRRLVLHDRARGARGLGLPAQRRGVPGADRRVIPFGPIFP